MHWLRRASTGQTQSSRVIALLVALLWTLLPYAGVRGEEAVSQWVAVPYCAVQASDASGTGEHPHRQVRLYLTSAAALLWAGGIAPALPAASGLALSAQFRFEQWRGLRARQAPHDAGLSLPAVRGPPAVNLLPA